MKQKTIIAILLCIFLLPSFMVVADDDIVDEAEDTLDDVAYYKDGVVTRDDKVTLVDTMPGIDIESMNVECTSSGLIVTLNVKESFPKGRVEGYEYGLEVYTNSPYGLITISYETDYGINNPGGWSSYGTPDFSVSDDSLMVTIDNLVIDESTVYLLDAYAEFDSKDGAKYLDWLPNGGETGDDTDSSPVDDSNETDDQIFDDNSKQNDTGDIDSSKNNESDTNRESPGFGLFFLIAALIGFIGISKYKRKE